MSLDSLFFWGVPIIALAAYTLLFLFLIISKKDRTIRAFVLVLVPLIIWTGSSLLMKLHVDPSPLFWNKVMLVGAFSASYLMYLFICEITHSNKFFGKAVWGIVTAVAIATNLMGFIVTDAKMLVDPGASSNPFLSAPQFVYTLGPGTVLAYVCLFLLIFSILTKILVAIKNEVIPRERLTTLAFGVFAIFLGFLFNLMPSLGRYPFDLLGGFINAVCFAIAVFRHRIFQIKFIITRGIVFSFFAAFIIAGYVYLIYFFERFLPLENSFTHSLLLAGAALVAALAFQPLFGASFRVVNRLFYHSEYDRRQALRNFSLIISNNINLNEISIQLLEAVESAIRVKRCCLMLRTEDGSRYNIFRLTDQLSSMDFSFRSDSPIVSWLIENDTCLVKSDFENYPQFKSLWTSEKRLLENLDVNAIVPLKCHNGLIGMLVLSDKDNNTSFTLEDIDLLTSFGASAAIAIDNARLYKRAQEDAITDSLTGLYNQRFLYQYLEKCAKSSPEKTVSLMFIDADMFKLFNDIYGHFEGDEALKQIADTIRITTGKAAVNFRYAGDQFVSILPDCDSRKAFEAGEKIRSEIQRRSVENPSGVKRFLTVSIGICTYPYAAPNHRELLKRADIALFKAKSSGKNTSVIYTPDTYAGRVSETQDNVRDGKGVAGAKSYSATLYALTAAIDAKDHYTFSHSQKVAQYTAALAAEIGMDHSHVEILTEAALLHDVGKIGVPEHILAKHGPLTNAEFGIMKGHVETSIEIVKHLPSLNYVIPAIIGHHERWDGTGYPRGIKGEDIPIGARCLSIADAFDAIVSYRPYKTSLSVEHALREIEKNSGTQFDPSIAPVFVRMVREGKIKVVDDPTITAEGVDLRLSHAIS